MGGGTDKYPSPDWVETNPTTNIGGLNLILNSDWRKPVSRRGIYNLSKKDYKGYKYTIDMWEMTSMSDSAVQKNDYINFYHEDEGNSFYYKSSADYMYMRQYVTKYNMSKLLSSNIFTFSVCYFEDGEYKYGSITDKFSSWNKSILDAEQNILEKDLFFKFSYNAGAYYFYSNAKVIAIKLEKSNISTLSYSMSLPANPVYISQETGQYITSTLNEDLHLNINKSDFIWPTNIKDYKLFTGIKAMAGSNKNLAYSFESLMTNIDRSKLKIEYYGYDYPSYSGTLYKLYIAQNELQNTFSEYVGYHSISFNYTPVLLPSDYKLYDCLDGINVSESYYDTGYVVGAKGNVIETREEYANTVDVPDPILSQAGSGIL